MKEKKPLLGDVVHYVDTDTGLHVPATVTIVLDAVTIDLAAMRPYVQNAHGFYPARVLFLEFIRQDEDSKRPGTWHWPERD